MTFGWEGVAKVVMYTKSNLEIADATLEAGKGKGMELCGCCCQQSYVWTFRCTCQVCTNSALCCVTLVGVTYSGNERTVKVAFTIFIITA